MCYEKEEPGDIEIKNILVDKIEYTMIDNMDKYQYFYAYYNKNDDLNATSK
ncbi:hypothetical protein D3C87_2072450 [compost metagenome]